MEPKLRLEYSEKKSFFVVWNFFKKLLPHFLWTLQTCSRFLESLPNTALCVNEKTVTVWHNNMILCQEKSKKLKFWKMKSKMRFEYFDKPQFLRWNSFSKVSINFLWVLWISSRNLEGPHNLDLCVNKKIVIVRHTFPKIFLKTWKKLFFRYFSWQNVTLFAVFLKTDDLRYPMT